MEALHARALVVFEVNCVQRMEAKGCCSSVLESCKIGEDVPPYPGYRFTEAAKNSCLKREGLSYHM